MHHMKICFLSLNSYPLLTGKNLGYVGGAEVEQVHLARELLDHGYDVYFITYHYGLNRIENVDGIKVIKTYEREKSDQISVLLKYMSIWSSLKKANADIYFHEAGSTGVLALFCCMSRKKFVYRIPSDAIVISKPLSGNYSFNAKIMNVLEIKRADIVVAQTNFQKRILKQRFNVKSVVIKNGLMIPRVNCKKQSPPTVLWVASISSVKRPHLFVELAKSIPHARFEMVGGKTAEEPKLYDQISAATRKLLNFRFHGFVPYHKVDEYFEKASIFVNTSSTEGFPNTFIQAWMHYTPVVSLNVDPDGIIRNEKLGFCSGTFKQLVSDVTSLLEDEKLRKSMGENGRKYVEREHDIRKIVKKYIKIFREILIKP
ncbi:MAG: glycosyltransferase family 4 protein [Candidatus Bathyarchaeia archaeon]